MLTTSIEIDKTALRQKSEQVKSGLRRLVQDAVNEGGQKAVAFARQGRFKDVTGDLRRDISAKPLGWQGDAYYVQVHAFAQKLGKYYALFVEEDTKAHEIRPKAGFGDMGPVRPGQSRRGSGRGPHEHVVGRGQFLRWKNADGEHFARVVHHPGTAGKHFMREAAESTEVWLRTRIKNGFAGIEAVLN